MIRESLKKNKLLVSLYQRIIGYKAGSKQWCRIVMDEETDRMIKELPFASFDALEISGDKWKDFGFKNYRSVNYPEFDLCAGPLPDQFDLVIAEQVFEHLLLPYQAGKNILPMLRNGGYLLITTPFLIRVHDFPVDCSRWSPLGLKYFLAECGFDTGSIQVDAWGNRECVIANLDEWMPFNPDRHSLKNDKDFPVVVWALARK